jgi:hypothetical protein
LDIDCAAATVCTVCKIESLDITGCTAIEHNFVTGDDRGGIALSQTSVFYTGDSTTGRFVALDLSAPTSLGAQYDALTSNLLTGQVYTLGDDITPIPFGGGSVTTLLAIDANGALLTGPATTVTLSNPIVVGSNTGIFAGAGRVVLHTGRNVYSIAIPSGHVFDHGAVTTPSHTSCESWAYWGAAEFFDNNLYVSYVADSQTISRMQIPSGTVSTVATFTSLSDMCSFTVSATRWYFHHESGSQFRSGDETIGFCAAAVAIENCADGVDNDSDGAIDCQDLNCVGHVACPESQNCNDGIDNDNYLQVDCSDVDCCGIAPCAYPNAICPEICNDNIENDGDQAIDCRDEDCCNSAFCPPAISCPSNRTVCAGSVLTYEVQVTDNCRSAPPRLFITNGIASGGIVPIGVTTTSYTAVDSGGLTASCSFNVVGNVQGQRCDDELLATSNDRCIDSELSNGRVGVVSECVGGCILSGVVDTDGCPIGDNVAFQFSNDGAKLCTRMSAICDSGRCK